MAAALEAQRVGAALPPRMTLRERLWMRLCRREWGLQDGQVPADER